MPITFIPIQDIFVGAQLQGASLDYAELQGASLLGTSLQGASLTDAQLQGASLVEAELQGADFSNAILDHANLDRVWTWRSRNAACTKARVMRHRPYNVIDSRDIFASLTKKKSTSEEIGTFVERSVAEIPDIRNKESVASEMRERLLVKPAKDDTELIAKVWSNCEAATSSTPQAQYDEEHAMLLRNLVCDATQNRASIAQGIVDNWIRESNARRGFSVQLARGLLGQDGKGCAATEDFDEATKRKLRAAAAMVVPAAAPAK
jgi:hypothetical protein